MADTAARMLALLGLLQARADWSGAELAAAAAASPTGPSATTSTGCAGSATRSTPSAGRAVATGSASAPSCRRCCSRRTRRSRSPSACAPAPAVQRHRGDQRPRAGQARARAPPPAPAPGQRAARRRDRRPGEHRLERRRPGRRPVAARRGGRPRSATTWSCGSTTGATRLQVEPYRLVSWQRRWFVVARDARTDTWAPYRLDWMQLRTPGGRRFTAAAAARRGLHVVRAARGGVLGLDRPRPHRRRRPGRGRAGPDQPDRRRGRERRRRPLRARHRRATASRSSPSTSACSASTSTSPSRPSWSRPWRGSASGTGGPSQRLLELQLPAHDPVADRSLTPIMWSLDSAFQVSMETSWGCTSRSQRFISVLSSTPSRWPRWLATTEVSCWCPSSGRSPSTATTEWPASSPVSRCRARTR